MVVWAWKNIMKTAEKHNKREWNLCGECVCVCENENKMHINVGIKDNFINNVQCNLKRRKV